MRFIYILTAGFFLTSGVFTNVPISAVPAPKIIEKKTKEASKHPKTADPANEETRENTQISPANVETQEEKLVQLKEITDPSNEKKESAQNSPAEKPKTPSVSTVDYGKIIEQQLSDFLERDLAKNIAAFSSLPEGLKKAFFVGDKVYPGFSTLAQLFVSGLLGGSDCPGVDPNAPCCVLLFPHASEIVLPLVCFKATLVCFKTTPESLIVKNLQSEANKEGEYQLTELPLSNGKLQNDKTYRTWIFGSTTLLSSFKDFSTVTALLDTEAQSARKMLSVELDVESLSAFMPLPVLKLAYDTYVKKDFEKIIYILNIDGEKLQFSSRYQFKPQTPWSVFCKAIHERRKTFRSLNFPSEAAMKTFFYWDPSSDDNLFKSLSTYAKEAEWNRDPIAFQVYRWGQLLYPLYEAYLDFMKTASVGNSQSYSLGAEWFGFEELKSTITDKALADFLDKFIKKCAYQLALAYNEHLLGSNYIESVSSGEKFLTHEDYGNIHRCGLKIRGYVPDKHDDSNELLLFVALYNGYLLYGNDLDRVASLFEQLKALSPFSYCSRPEAIFSSRTEFEHPKGIIETSCNAEVAPEAFSTTASIPLSFIEAVGSLIFGNTYSDKSEDTEEAEKTSKNNVTNNPSNVSELPRESEGNTNISNPAISAQSAAVR